MPLNNRGVSRPFSAALRTNQPTSVILIRRRGGMQLSEEQAHIEEEQAQTSHVIF
jgi:hypothetical protein